MAALVSSLNTSSQSLADITSEINDKVNSSNVTSEELSATVSRIKELAEGANDGIKVLGPWEWVGISSLIKLYQEQGVDLNELKAVIDAVPKS